MLIFFDDYLHAKNQRDRLIPFRYINDQRTAPSEWKRGANGETLNQKW